MDGARAGSACAVVLCEIVRPGGLGWLVRALEEGEGHVSGFPLGVSAREVVF